MPLSVTASVSSQPSRTPCLEGDCSSCQVRWPSRPSPALANDLFSVYYLLSPGTGNQYQHLQCCCQGLFFASHCPNSTNRTWGNFTLPIVQKMRTDNEIVYVKSVSDIRHVRHIISTHIRIISTHAKTSSAHTFNIISTHVSLIISTHFRHHQHTHSTSSAHICTC